MNSSAPWWRRAAGGAIVVFLLAFGVLLIPHYARNYEFQRALSQIANSQLSASDDSLRLAVAESAARLGLRVRPEQVRISRASESTRIDVPYVIPVDLPIYTVDLHFRPSASR